MLCHLKGQVQEMPLLKQGSFDIEALGISSASKMGQAIISATGLFTVFWRELQG